MSDSAERSCIPTSLFPKRMQGFNTYITWFAMFILAFASSSTKVKRIAVKSSRTVREFPLLQSFLYLLIFNAVVTTLSVGHVGIFTVLAINIQDVNVG